jgi:hypothetical protein
VFALTVESCSDRVFCLAPDTSERAENALGSTQSVQGGAGRCRACAVGSIGKRSLCIVRQIARVLPRELARLRTVMQRWISIEAF